MKNRMLLLISCSIFATQVAFCAKPKPKTPSTKTAKPAAKKAAQKGATATDASKAKTAPSAGGASLAAGKAAGRKVGSPSGGKKGATARPKNITRLIVEQDMAGIEAITKTTPNALNEADKKGRIPFFLAAAKGQTLAPYLKLGAKIDVVGQNGENVLHTTARFNRKNPKVIFDEVAKLNPGLFKQVNTFKSTVLHAAVYQGNLAAAKALIEGKLVDINAIDSKGNTALHIAYARNFKEIADYLEAAAGVKKDIKNSKGKTAVDLKADMSGDKGKEIIKKKRAERREKLKAKKAARRGKGKTPAKGAAKKSPTQRGGSPKAAAKPSTAHTNKKAGKKSPSNKKSAHKAKTPAKETEKVKN